MTSLFKLIGSGDTMTGMTRAVYVFTAIIGIVILVCAIFMIRNYLNARRKSGVQLKSKTAEKKKERRKQGLFNYDVIDGEDEMEGLDPTDPRNQKHDRKKKKHDVRQVERVGMKAVKTEPQKLTMSNKSTRKVGLRKKTDNAVPSASTTDNTMNEPVTEPVIILDDKNYEPDIDFDNTPEPSQTVPPEPEPSFDDNDYNGFSIEGMPQTPVQSQQPAQPAGRHAAPKHDENPFNAENPFANMIDPSALKQ